MLGQSLQYHQYADNDSDQCLQLQYWNQFKETIGESPEKRLP